MPFLKDKFLDENGETSRKKLIFLRIVLWSFTIGVTLLIESFNYILELAGSIFAPFCSYFIPVSSVQALLIENLDLAVLHIQ